MKNKKIVRNLKTHSSNSTNMTKQIIRYYADNQGKPMGLSAVMRKLNTNKSADVVRILNELEAKKTIQKVTPGKYIYSGLKVNHEKVNTKSDTFEGIVDMASAGFAYILCKGLSKDVFVSSANLKSAQDGDYVQIKITRPSPRRPEGLVTKIIQRSKTQFVGIYRIFKNQSYVLVKQRNQNFEIFLNQANTLIPEDFDRVVVEVSDFKNKASDRMLGKISQILGKESTVDIEMKSIIAEQGFGLEFPQAVLEETKNMSDKITDISKRRDFREICCFTIDPIDAKDFDDALSIRRDENNDLEIGVHIADVSYYVEPNSALDKEALKRGNSVYLVDRVLPMLPERLSNELCSLRPNEDKATFSAVFTFDEERNIKKHWIGKTIIHSQRRFAYEEVQDILVKGEGELFDELFLLDTIAKKIRVERLKNGAIDFETEEVRFKLDDNGNPLELYVKERLDAHMLIEEYMLLANKYVATFIAKKNKAYIIPFVYRIHDKPDPEKLAEFGEFALEMGIHLDFNTPKKIAKSMNLLADKARQDSSLKVLQSLAIRTMAKAAYSPDNIGHYGLSFEYYSHFTSPIRRYSDLMVHRILLDNLEGEKRYQLDIIERQCTHISSQERKAMIAERESTKYFQVLFLKEQLGKEFDGIITGMNNRGIFVEMLQNRCEAILPLETLGSEVEVNKNRLSVSLVKGTKPLKMGDKLKVRLISANLEDKELVVNLA
ncbi:MAG: ribonuclease R [Saprospiraceae bacterium]|nr:ribonuclease R [Saprospiraceae bacterium]